MTRTAKSARLLAAAMDDYAPTAMGWQRWRAREQAKQHLASMTPERRALLEQEWAGDEPTCSICGEDLEADCSPSLEAFEIVGDLVCDDCVEDVLQDHSQFGVGA